MASVSGLRKIAESRGMAWTPEMYQYAKDRLGNSLVDDEGPPAPLAPFPQAGPLAPTGPVPATREPLPGRWPIRDFLGGLFGASLSPISRMGGVQNRAEMARELRAPTPGEVAAQEELNAQPALSRWLSDTALSAANAATYGALGQLDPELRTYSSVPYSDKPLVQFMAELGPAAGHLAGMLRGARALPGGPVSQFGRYSAGTSLVENVGERARGADIGLPEMMGEAAGEGARGAGIAKLLGALPTPENMALRLAVKEPAVGAGLALMDPNATPRSVLQSALVMPAVSAPAEAGRARRARSAAEATLQKQLKEAQQFVVEQDAAKLAEMEARKAPVRVAERQREIEGAAGVARQQAAQGAEAAATEARIRDEMGRRTVRREDLLEAINRRTARNQKTREARRQAISELEAVRAAEGAAAAAEAEAAQRARAQEFVASLASRRKIRGVGAPVEGQAPLPMPPAAPKGAPGAPVSQDAPQATIGAGAAPEVGRPPENAPGGARGPGDVVLGVGLGGIQGIKRGGRAKRARPKTPPVEAVPNNPVDAANIAYKRTRDPRAYVASLPEKPEVAPEVFAGILMGEKASPPKGSTFDAKDKNGDPILLPPQIGGKIVQEVGTNKRFYVDAKGQFWKPILDVPAAESMFSDPDQMLAGVGGGRMVGPKGSENPAISHVFMPSEQALLNAASRASDRARTALRVFRDTGLSETNTADMRRITRVWKLLNNDFDLSLDPRSILVRPGVDRAVSGARDPLRLIEAAQRTKSLMMDEFELVNAVRAKMGMSPIGVQQNYAPKLRKTNWFQREFGLVPATEGSALGLEKEAGSAPRWTKPGVTNPRAMARQPGLEYPAEERADVLLANYFHHMTREAFATPALENARAVARAYEHVGLTGSASNINAYADGVLANMEGPMFRWLPKSVKGPLRRMSELQSKAVLGSLRFAVTQASGQAVQAGRLGVTNIPRGIARIIGDKDTAGWILDNVPSIQRKAAPHGSISRQDLSEFNNALRDKTAWHEYIGKTVEEALSMVAAAGAYDAGIRRGMKPRSRELAQYISGEVKRIQGGYNRAERAGLVRDPEAGVFFGKFQGYGLQINSQLRSLLFPGTKIGRVDYYKEQGPATRRAYVAARWVAAMAASNMVSGLANWGWESVVPWASQTGLGDDRRRNRLWLPGEFWKDASGAFEDIVERGNGMKLRKFVLRWRVPLGIQADYAIDGYNAWKDGGHYITDKNGVRRKLFSVGDDELFVAMTLGPYATKEGKEYLNRGKKEDQGGGGASSARQPQNRSPAPRRAR